MGFTKFSQTVPIHQWKKADIVEGIIKGLDNKPFETLILDEVIVNGEKKQGLHKIPVGYFALQSLNVKGLEGIHLRITDEGSREAKTKSGTFRDFLIEIDDKDVKKFNTVLKEANADIPF